MCDARQGEAIGTANSDQKQKSQEPRGCKISALAWIFLWGHLHRALRLPGVFRTRITIRPRASGLLNSPGCKECPGERQVSYRTVTGYGSRLYSSLQGSVSPRPKPTDLNLATGRGVQQFPGSTGAAAPSLVELSPGASMGTDNEKDTLALFYPRLQGMFLHQLLNFERSLTIRPGG